MFPDIDVNTAIYQPRLTEFLASLPSLLALALLVTWVDTDHSNRAVTANNLAVPAHLLN